MTELAVVDAAAIERLDPAAREIAVTAYLTDARDRLALALHATGPEAVAAIKAEIATAAEATKQLGLSKEIQTDAIEMVRRAEFALGKAIRAGQEAGSVRDRQGNLRQNAERVGYDFGGGLASPTDFATRTELSGNGIDNAGIYALVDGVSEPEFDAALADARTEGNLSRANVVRKIKGVKSEGLTPLERLRKIRDLAPTGRTSGQIAQEIGVTEDTVRETARKNGIVITADKLLKGTHRVRVDADHVVNHAVMTLDVIANGVRDLDITALDESQIQHWADSLTDSLRVLNRFAKSIKEKAQ